MAEENNENLSDNTVIVNEQNLALKICVYWKILMWHLLWKLVELKLKLKNFLD